MECFESKLTIEIIRVTLVNQASSVTEDSRRRSHPIHWLQPVLGMQLASAIKDLGIQNFFLMRTNKIRALI
jgi:hypothetical protein